MITLPVRFKKNYFSVAICLASLYPAAAFANVLLGYLPVYLMLPVFIQPFLFVLAIESVILWKALPLRFGKALAVALITNIASALLGFMLAILYGLAIHSDWTSAAAMSIQVIGFVFSELILSTDSLHLLSQLTSKLPGSTTYVYIAFASFLLVCFFVSWACEYGVAKLLFSATKMDMANKKVGLAFFWANLISYLAISLIIFGTALVFTQRW